MHPSVRALVPAATVSLLLAACGGGAEKGGGATVETRADGVVVVYNPERGTWPAGGEWRLEEDLRIGTAIGEGPTLFGNVMAVEADSMGRIWVLDSHAKEIRVFDARGKYVRRIGREGAGPGEFRNPVAMTWAPDGTLWVVDPGMGRFTVFDTAGLFIATHPRRIVGQSIPWRGGFGPDRLLYEVEMVPGPTPVRSRSALLRYDASMEPADTFLLPEYRGEQFELRQESGFMAAGVPFTPFQLVALDPRGFVWTGVTDRYRFAQRRSGGDTTRIVERQAPPVPVSAAERDDAVERLKWFTEQGGRVDAGRIPATKPAYDQLLVGDDGGIWVRPSRPAGAAGAAFDVFDADGRYGGRVHLPGGMDAYPPPLVRGGAMYGVARDSLGVPYVVRARIVRGG